MKTQSAFKLRSGNKPSMAKMAGVMKDSPAKLMFGTPSPKKSMSNPDKVKKEGKKKVTFAEAYKKRDMKTYGNLNQAEYTKEAKRQIKNFKSTSKTRPKTDKELQSEMPGGKNFKKSEPRGSGERMTTPKGSYDAPKSQMKGSLKPADKTTTTTKTKLPVTKESKKTQSVKDAKAKRKIARKAVKVARKVTGRGSDAVKAAKEARKTAKKNVRTAKKNRRATKKQTKEFLKS